ncbi:NAD(P)/FAD-dependent oxidoreductase [Streptomyces qinglanensis]|uniref:Predicted NAD/FAD-binding protein n=1 Tax=Streptomyces qinglanensis TaxID=943816 RepID=A0A1H9TVW5_9ACTN|nr:FAD-dependent oxidoreductase [Streptomyces qinglanensis]SES01148.1 Predicted NAD/FAD-binding protein [Streptomyces qinglanensis]
MAAQLRRTAVIGSGIAGLTAAWLLRTTDEVTLFEADDRLGGHTHTHEVVTADGRPLPVDSGFIVHNTRTYPLLTRLFGELGVATQESEMSMSVQCAGCGLEYAGAKGPSGLFPRPGHLRRGRYLRMLTEIPVFHRRALRTLAAEDDLPADGSGSPQTLGAFVRSGGFSSYFTSHYLAPLVSAVWSCAPDTALQYPARYLFRFLSQHGMLGIGGSPVWRTVTGGSHTYVQRIAKELPDIRTSAPVRAVRRHSTGGAGAEIVTADGQEHHYDKVVLAVHADQALRVLERPTEDEKRVLGAFRWSRNPALLHTDSTVLPRSPGAGASWNYRMPDCTAPPGRVRVSYDMTRLQHLAAPDRYVVSLGEGEHVDPGRVLARMVYEHPVYTPESVAAQRRLPQLESGPVVYAGAWHGWGFHEDGCRSGVAAARSLGVRW